MPPTEVFVVGDLAFDATAGLSEAQCQLRVSLRLHLVGRPPCRTLVSFGNKDLSIFALAGTIT